jgi:hypothetical protein
MLINFKKMNSLYFEVKSPNGEFICNVPVSDDIVLAATRFVKANNNTATLKKVENTENTEKTENTPMYYVALDLEQPRKMYGCKWGKNCRNMATCRMQCTKFKSGNCTRPNCGFHHISDTTGAASQ